jgi:MoaA/NifB/PqqE/SkfB family radical SAM enzyme
VTAEKQLLLFDFWHHGPVVEGCLSTGREGGYIYVDWNGKIMPCVFAPYSVGNIRESCAQGGTLNDIWEAPFFEVIRFLQRVPR